MQTTDNKQGFTGGTGTEGYERGAQVTTRSQVQPGDLLINDDERSLSTDLIKVERLSSAQDPCPGLWVSFAYEDHPHSRTSVGRVFFVHEAHLEEGLWWEAEKPLGEQPNS